MGNIIKACCESSGILYEMKYYNPLAKNLFNLTENNDNSSDPVKEISPILEKKQDTVRKGW